MSLQKWTFYILHTACLRPHGELQPQTLGTRMHSYLIATYNIISVGICATLYWKIKSEDERLSSVLKFKVKLLEIYVEIKRTVLLTGKMFFGKQLLGKMLFGKQQLGNMLFGRW